MCVTVYVAHTRVCACLRALREREREGERETDRQTDRERDRQTDRERLGERLYEVVLVSMSFPVC
jgi:hypothetical protein